MKLKAKVSVPFDVVLIVTTRRLALKVSSYNLVVYNYTQTCHPFSPLTCQLKIISVFLRNSSYQKVVTFCLTKIHTQHTTGHLKISLSFTKCHLNHPSFQYSCLGNSKVCPNKENHSTSRSSSRATCNSTSPSPLPTVIGLHSIEIAKFAKIKVVCMQLI